MAFTPGLRIRPLETVDRTAFGLVLVAVLAVASILPARYAVAWPDTIRDISIALAFARGETLPLVGPMFNFGPHFGPAWYWLLAPVLAIVPSMAGVGVFAAVLSSLKFVGLFGLGRMLSGNRLGACFAAAAAIPSIAVYQWMVVFQPNIVESAIVGTWVLLAAGWRARSVAWVQMAAAMLGLAIQMHPTAAFYYPLVVATLIGLGVRGGRLALHVAFSLALIGAWFAPLLLARALDYPEMVLLRALDQGEGLDNWLTRIAIGLDTFSATSVLTVLRTAYVEVPLAMVETYGGAIGVPRPVSAACLAVVAVVAAAGLAALARDPLRRRWAVGAMAALIAGWTIVTAMRIYTSFYLAYFLLPLGAVILGWAIHEVLGSTNVIRRALGGLALASFVALALGSSLGASKVGRTAFMHSRLPVLADLRNPVGERVEANLATLAARDAFAKRACSQRAFTAHGELAFALGGSTGLDFRLHCPGAVPDVRLLGSSEGQAHWSAMPAGKAESLGVRPHAVFRGLAVIDVKRAIHPPIGRPIESDWHYFERLRDRQPLTRVTLTFRAEPLEKVMIYRLKPFDSHWRQLRVERDGVAAMAALSTFNSEVYASAATGSDWRIEFETDAPQWVDVHLF